MNNFITIEEDSIKKCKNFGYTFSFIFFLIFLYDFFFMSKNLAYYFLALSVFFSILTYLRPNLLRFLSDACEKFGLFLGRIASPIVMGLIYFFVVTPTGVIMKIFGKDLLGLKRSNRDSYWIERKLSSSSMKNLF